MKKLICLTLTLLLCVAAFMGCSSTEATRSDRWSDETVTYAITMLKDAEGDAAAEEGFFNYLKNPGTQVKPDSVEASSRFSYTIKYVNDRWELTQETILCEKFIKANHSVFSNDSWKSTVKDSGIYTDNGDSVTITTTARSTVVFKSFLQGGAAVRSEKTVKGIFMYMGDTETEHKLAYNDFTVTVDYQGKTAKTKFEDRNPGEWNNPGDSNAGITEGVYDNEMFIFAVRSLNLQTLVTSVQNATATFNSYNGLAQITQTISVIAQEKKFSDASDAPLFYKVQVNPQNESYPYMFYFETANTIRPASSLGGSIPKYELVHFTQGYMKFTKI